MKKFYVVLLSLIMCFVSICFVGCGDKEDEFPSFENVEIGYCLPVYPNCEFDYKVSDECTVHVKEIKVELTSKNVVNSNGTILSPYFPYVFHVSVSATTDAKYANKQIYLRLIIEEMNQQFYYYETTIQSDGSIKWDYDQTRWTSLTKVYFNEITFKL